MHSIPLITTFTHKYSTEMFNILIILYRFNMLIGMAMSSQSKYLQDNVVTDCMEMDTDYFMSDIVPIDQAPRAGSWQECSDLCRNKYAECKFWTLIVGKCLVKTSKDGKRNKQGAISGSRECGSNTEESGEDTSGPTPGIDSESGENSSGSVSGSPVATTTVATTTEKPCKADNDNGINMDIGDGRIYAGFFTRSYGTSGKITFNICKKGSTYGAYDCSHPGGEITIYGGSKERPYISTLPTKIDITENAKKAGISKVDDVRFYVTSIQDTAGKKIEKEVFQPIRVFRPKIRCYDFYTIFFNTSVIQPPAIEITKKVKFKIESPNKKIFQVNTEGNYKKCNEQTFFCMDNKYQLGYNNYKCNIGTGNSTKNNNENIGNGSENILKSNGSYYLFDKDGLPKSCAGGAASNGSEVQIILTEFARESGKYIGSGN